MPGYFLITGNEATKGFACAVGVREEHVIMWLNGGRSPNSGARYRSADPTDSDDHDPLDDG